MTNSAIVYRGPSRIDGEPVVAIVSGLNQSYNRKTGDMLQVYILVDNGVAPLQNQMNGGDVSVCGDCPLRPKDGKLGACYVNTGQGPAAIFSAYQSGLPDLEFDQKKPSAWAKYLREQMRGRAIRLGAYGEPVALPLRVIKQLVHLSGSWTGYTHQWRQPWAQPYRQYVMASVETEAERSEAKLAWWRTFRVRAENEKLGPSEIECPASERAGKRLTCGECLSCRGALTSPQAYDVSIEVHGLQWKKQKFSQLVGA